MWIYLIKELTVDNSPPLFSIHWSLPNDKSETAQKQKQRANRYLTYEQYHDVCNYDDYVNSTFDDDKLFDYDYESTMGFSGYEPNFVKSRIIHFNGENIVIFPHEFTEMSADKFQDFVFNEHASHKLIEGNVSASVEKLVNITQDSDLKSLYEYGLLEGCNDSMAKLLAIGELNPLDDNWQAQPFPMGWYCIQPHYAVYYNIDVSEYFPNYPVVTGKVVMPDILIVGNEIITVTVKGDDVNIDSTNELN